MVRLPHERDLFNFVLAVERVEPEGEGEFLVTLHQSYAIGPDRQPAR